MKLGQISTSNWVRKLNRFFFFFYISMSHTLCIIKVTHKHFNFLSNRPISFLIKAISQEMVSACVYKSFWISYMKRNRTSTFLKNFHFTIIIVYIYSSDSNYDSHSVTFIRGTMWPMNLWCRVRNTSQTIWRCPCR